MSQQPSGTPQVCVSQVYGDGLTVYIVHGSGYPPDRPVTVSLAGVGPSPDRPVTDRQGTFSYAIDQGHHFFRGPIPLGKYTAVVTAPGERSASVRFQVGAGPSTGPPGQPPGPVTPGSTTGPPASSTTRDRQQPQVGGGDHAVLDQDPHGDLIRQADARAREPAVGDLAAQHLEMLGDSRRQAVAVLRVGVEPSSS